MSDKKEETKQRKEYQSPEFVEESSLKKLVRGAGSGDFDGSSLS